MNHRLSTFLFLLAFAFQFSACAQEPKAEEPFRPAMSNEQIASYIRKVFNVPGNVQITVKESSQSRIAGTYPILVEFKGERGNQEQEAWITKDNTLIVGKTFNLNEDPFKKNLEKITTVDAPSTGAPDAKVVIVEYSDFQCPFCSRAHVTVKDVLKLYEGKVKLFYKHLPLTNIHDWAEPAAIASLCVNKQNSEAFWKFSDYLFANQKEITKDTLNSRLQEFSAQSSLNFEELQKCIADPATKLVITAHSKEAGDLGLGSTPSFMVNGRPVIGAVPMEQFKQVIDEALAEVN